MVRPLDPVTLARRLAETEDDLVLLDCRTGEEVSRAAIPGAVHIPMDQIPARLGELDPDREYAVLCHHGIRSALVCRFLVNRVFGRTWNVSGGIDAYARHADPRVGTY